MQLAKSQLQVFTGVQISLVFKSPWVPKSVLSRWPYAFLLAFNLSWSSLSG